MPSLGSAVFSLRTDAAQFHSGLAGAEAAANKSAASIGAKLSSIGSKLSHTGAVLTRKLTLPMAAVGAGAVKMSLDFHEAMTMIETQAGAPEGEIEKLENRIKNLAKRSIHGPKQLAEALFFIESAGFRGGKAMDVLELASKGAMVGNADLASVTNALAAAMNTGIKGTESSTEAMGILNATIGQGQMHMDDMTAALSTGIVPAAKSMGLSFADVGGALAVMTAQGIPAQVAATRLGMTFLKMLPVGKQSVEAFKAMGLGTNDLANKMRGKGGLPSAIELLQKRYTSMVQRMGKNEAQRALLQMFPRGLAKSLLTLMESYDTLAEKTDEIRKKSTDFPKAVRQASEENINKIKTAWSSVQVALVNLGDLLAPIVVKIVNALSSLVEWFQKLPDEAKRAIGTLVIVLVALGPGLTILGKFLSMWGLLIRLLPMLMSPAGLIIAAIAALAIGFLVAWRHSETFRRVVHTAIEAVRNAMQVFVAWVKTVWAAHGAQIAAVARQAWSAITAYVRAGIAVWTAIIKAGVAVVRAIWDAFGKQITSVVRAVWAYIGKYIQNAMKIIKGVIDVVMGVLHGDWGRAWNGLKAIVSGVWGQIKALIQLNWALIRAILSAAASFLTTVFSKAWSGIKSGFASLWSAVWRGAKNFANTIRETALRIMLAIVEPFSHLPTKLGGGPFQRLKRYIEGELKKISAKEAADKLAKQLTEPFNRAAREGPAKAAVLGGAIRATVPRFQKLGEEIGGAIAVKAVNKVDAMRGPLKLGVLGSIAGLGPVQRTAGAMGGAIGVKISDGVISGIGALARRVAMKISSEVRAGIDTAYKRIGSTGYEYTRDAVGKPTGRGIVDGMVSEVRKLSAAILKPLRDALKAASAELSATNAKLTAIRNRQAAQDLKWGIESARIALDQARRDRDQAIKDAKGKTDAVAKATRDGNQSILEAQRQLTRALEAVDIAALDRKLAREQKAHDRAQRALEKAMEKQKAALQKALDRQKNLIERARSKMSAAWDKLSQKALSAFDAITGAFVAPAQQQINEIQARREAEDAAEAVAEADRSLADARMEVTAATDALAKAQAALIAPLEEGQSPADLQQAVSDAVRRIQSANLSVIAAERTASRAREDVQLIALEKEATNQVTAWEQERAALREHLDNRLALLIEKLSKEGAAWDTAMSQITALLGEYGVEFEASGLLLGQMFANGFKAAAAEAASAAQELLDLLDRLNATTGAGKAHGPGGGNRPDNRAPLLGGRATSGVDAGAVSHISLPPSPAGDRVPDRRLTGAPLVGVQGDLVVQKQEDADLVASMLARKIRVGTAMA